MNRVAVVRSLARAMGAVIIAGLVAGGPVAAAAAGEKEVGRQIETAFEESYTARNPAKLKPLYAPGARIQTRLQGEIDEVKFLEGIGADMARIASVDSADFTVNEISITGKEGLLKGQLSLRGTFAEGKVKTFDRVDPLFMKLRLEGKKWLVVMQSYREDFTPPVKGDKFHKQHSEQPGLGIQPVTRRPLGETTGAPATEDSTAP